ncbi:hypothetical protein ACI3EY_07915 [Ornithinimicrobium sp. LYQ92]|uniref:hypothetical protein n=1 Tax=Serinicoccus sp. LYQ92 TaxID=3378798 RepID=UPI00385198EB
MTWFKVDDKLWGHPKWMSLPPGARALWVTAGSYCASNETDGIVPTSALLALGGRRRDAEALVEAGLWDAVDPAPRRRAAKIPPRSSQNPATSQPENDHGTDSAKPRRGRNSQPTHAYRFHDWEDYQPTRAQVRAERDAARERMRNVRSSRKGSDVRPNNSRTSPEVRDPRPDPSRPSSPLTPRSHVAGLLGWQEEDERLDHLDSLLATQRVRSPKAWINACHEAGDLETALRDHAQAKADPWANLPMLDDVATPRPGGDPT